MNDIKKVIKKTYNCIIPIGDLHFQKDNKREKEYKEMTNNVRENLEKINDLEHTLVVLTGDIYDKNNDISIYALDSLYYFIKKISEIVAVVLVYGNHDVNQCDENEKTIFDYIKKMVKCKNFQIFKESGIYEYDNIVFYVTNVFAKKVIQAKKDDFPNKIKIGIYHGQMKCGFYGKKYTDKSYSNSIFSIYDFSCYHFCICGDKHTYDIIGNLIYSGSLLRLDHSEKIYQRFLLTINIENWRGMPKILCTEYNLNYFDNFKDELQELLTKEELTIFECAIKEKNYDDYKKIANIIKLRNLRAVEEALCIKKYEIQSSYCFLSIEVKNGIYDLEKIEQKLTKFIRLKITLIDSDDRHVDDILHILEKEYEIIDLIIEESIKENKIIDELYKKNSLINQFESIIGKMDLTDECKEETTIMLNRLIDKINFEEHYKKKIEILNLKFANVYEYDQYEINFRNFNKLDEYTIKNSDFLFNIIIQAIYGESINGIPIKEIKFNENKDAMTEIILTINKIKYVITRNIICNDSFVKIVEIRNTKSTEIKCNDKKNKEKIIDNILCAKRHFIEATFLNDRSGFYFFESNTEEKINILSRLFDFYYVMKLRDIIKKEKEKEKENVCVEQLTKIMGKILELYQDYCMIYSIE